MFHNFIEPFKVQDTSLELVNAHDGERTSKFLTDELKSMHERKSNVDREKVAAE